MATAVFECEVCGERFRSIELRLPELPTRDMKEKLAALLEEYYLAADVLERVRMGKEKTQN